MRKEKIRFIILKETDRDGVLKNVNEETFTQLDLGFSYDEFVEQVNFLYREDYITKPFYADNTVYLYDSVLTEKGESYLENNKWYKKAYKTAKEIKDWIK